MSGKELDNFVYKFHQLRRAGMTAHLDMDTQAGHTAKYSAYSFELFPDRFDFIPAFGVYNTGQKAWCQVRRQLDITLFGQYCMIRGKTVPQFNDSSLLPFSE